MRKIVILALCLFGLLPCSSAFSAKAKAKQIDGIAAVVNSSVITRSEVGKQLRVVKARLKKNNITLPSDQELRQQIINHLVDQTLQLQIAKRAGLQVNNTQINQSVAKIARHNGVDLPTLRKHMEKQGVGYSEFRREIAKELLINQVQQRELGQRIKINEQEVAQLAKSLPAQKQVTAYHLFDILVALPEEPSPKQVAAAKKHADKILAKLKQGTDFQTLAIASSSGQQALHGGDLGWHRLAGLPQAFAQRVVSLSKGEFTGPIKTPNGFHIIKLVDKKNQPNTHMVKEVQLRQIVLRTDVITTEDDVKMRLNQLRKKIRNGASFSKLAELNSEDPASASEGGKTGWLKVTELPRSIAQAVKSLKKNSISQPIETAQGWYLIQVLASKQIDNSKQHHDEKLRQLLFKRKFSEALENWLQELRGDTYIKVFKG